MESKGGLRKVLWELKRKISKQEAINLNNCLEEENREDGKEKAMPFELAMRSAIWQTSAFKAEKEVEGRFRRVRNPKVLEKAWLEQKKNEEK